MIKGCYNRTSSKRALWVKRGDMYHEEELLGIYKMWAPTWWITGRRERRLPRGHRHKTWWEKRRGKCRALLLENRRDIVRRESGRHICCNDEELLILLPILHFGETGRRARLYFIVKYRLGWYLSRCHYPKQPIQGCYPGAANLNLFVRLHWPSIRTSLNITICGV